MKRLAIAVGIAALISACSPSTNSAEPRVPKAMNPNGVKTIGATPSVISGNIAFNVGDVEQGLFFQATLANESRAPNVKLKALSDERHIIKTATITVSPPYPDHLWLLFYVRNLHSGPSIPVALRGAVTLGENNQTKIKSFSAVSYKLKPLPEFKVDLMPHLKPIPNAILVQTKVKAIIMPEGTNPASINPNTATGPLEKTTTILSNPLRVVFQKAPKTVPKTK